jgi:hypothetical protein
MVVDYSASERVRQLGLRQRLALIVLICVIRVYPRPLYRSLARFGNALI